MNYPGNITSKETGKLFEGTAKLFFLGDGMLRAREGGWSRSPKVLKNRSRQKLDDRHD